MVVVVPDVLAADELRQLHAILAQGCWADGRITAGSQSALVKNNQQLPDDDRAALAGRDVVVSALSRSARFFSAALPHTLFPPLFNRYAGSANAFGTHVDNAVRSVPGSGQRVRTDLSATLFLSAPESYDGGELVIEDTFGTHPVKLPAGHLVLYPASSLHRVQPVTRGARMASFFWIQSMVRESERRRLLFELDMSILQLRQTVGESDAVLGLTNCYHNLLRMWAQV